ncbi:MAG: hypothetical protein M3Y91_01375 [Actinomycetota bacterium]|nr:hypothetical protein [Actinomycetota bacterium]
MAERPVGKRRATDGSDNESTRAAAAPPRDRADDHLGEPDGLDGPASADDTHTALPPRVESWRKRSATGAILTGFALGLQHVFEPERKEPAIVQETSGDPPTDLPVEAELEGVVGRRSVVRIRPWLLDEDMAGAEEDADTGRSATTTGVAPRARRPRRLRRRR